MAARIAHGKLTLDPVHSPGVLDTATWDPPAAWAAALADNTWVAAGLQPCDPAGPLPAVPSAQDATGAPAQGKAVTVVQRTCIRQEDTTFCLLALPDGQRAFAVLGPAARAGLLGEPSGLTQVTPGPQGPPIDLALHPADARTLARFFDHLAPALGPRALGPVPRLGIGTRMTTAVWPAIWAAMAQHGFAANAIQNSVRELNFLDTLRAGHPPETNIAFGFGAIETGYTGSTFEGLWVSGVLHGLANRTPTAPPYGADADHIQVKRGAEGLARARRMLDATRYYTFYTLDVSDVLDYSALGASAAEAEAALASDLTAAARRDLHAFHRQGRRIAGCDYRPDAATLDRLTNKYAIALAAVAELYTYLLALKAGTPFDLELSIDEHPNDVPTFDCLTSPEELIFVLLEAQRRGIPLTHIAPNFGVEKGTDYRGADGHGGFEARARTLCRIAAEFGVMPDFHSGDDLSAASRQAIRRATDGRHHFKVSPNLQLLFGAVLADHHPDLFRQWYADAEAYAARQAAGGSSFAAACLGQAQAALRQPLAARAHDAVFHNYSFAFVGRRDARGQFLVREQFYSLSPAFYAAYQQCIEEYLGLLAADLL